MPWLRVEPGWRIAGPLTEHLRAARRGGSTRELGLLEGASATNHPAPRLPGRRVSGLPGGRRPDFGAGASSTGGRMGPGLVFVFDEPVNRTGLNEHELSAFCGFVAARRSRHEFVAPNAGRERVAIRITG